MNTLISEWKKFGVAEYVVHTYVFFCCSIVELFRPYTKVQVYTYTSYSFFFPDRNAQVKPQLKSFMSGYGTSSFFSLSKIQSIGLPLIPEPSGRIFIISSISFSSKAEAEPAGLMFLEAVASEIPVWSRSKVRLWDRPLATNWLHSEAPVDDVELEDPPLAVGDKLDTFEGGVRLFDLHGLGVLSMIGLLNALYCTMFPETPLIVTCGAVIILLWTWWLPPRSRLDALSWLLFNDWSQ